MNDAETQHATRKKRRARRALKKARTHLADPERWKLVGLETVDGSVLPDGAYAVGEGVNANGQRNMMGRVTSTYYSANLGKGIAMGLIKHGPDRMGEIVEIPGTDGKTYIRLRQGRIPTPMLLQISRAPGPPCRRQPI